LASIQPAPCADIDSHASAQDRRRSIAVDGAEVSPIKTERQGSGRASPGMSTLCTRTDDDNDDDGGLAGTPKVKDLDIFRTGATLLLLLLLRNLQNFNFYPDAASKWCCHLVDIVLALRSGQSALLYGPEHVGTAAQSRAAMHTPLAHARMTCV